MAGTLTRGYSFGATEEVTASKLHALVDDGTISGVTADEIASGTITDDKISSVGGSKFVNLANIPSGAGVIPSANLPSQASTIIGTIYPVGSIYISTLSTNPATLLGVGVWASFGAGRVLLSAGGGFTAGDTGGESTHTLTSNEMPAHTHSIQGRTSQWSSANEGRIMIIGGGSLDNTESTGGGAAHNNLQPYIVVYMWKRTS